MGRYVDAKTVVENAKQGGGGGRRFFNLPEGIEEWQLEEAGTYALDILPYLVTCDCHPDRINAGLLWYKRPFRVHFNIGPLNEACICPKSVGKKCPICEEATRLKNKDVDKETLDALGTQSWLVYNIRHPEDPKRVALFALSYGKFQKFLDKEIEEGSEEIRGFYHLDEAGATVSTRFSEKSYMGSKFLEATRIDFRPRKKMNEEAWLKVVAPLDDILIVLSYEKLKSMFLQVDDDDEDTDKEPESSEEAQEPAKKRRQVEDDDDEPAPKKEEKDEDDDEPEAPSSKKGKVEEKDEDEETDKKDEDDDESAPAKKNSKKEEPDDDADDDDEPAPARKKEAPKDEDEKEEEEAPPSAKEKKKGSKDTPVCPAADKGGVFGKSCDKFGKTCDDCPVWTECDKLTSQAGK